MRATPIVTVFVLLAISGMAFATTSSQSTSVPNPPSFTVATNMTTLCKGMTNYIPINVTNIGTLNPSVGISNLNGTPMQQVQLSIVGTKTLTPTGNGTVYILTPIDTHQSAVAYLLVFVTSNASLITTAEINVNFNYLMLYSDSETRNLTFEVQSCPSPLSVSIKPTTVASGQIQNLSISLTNIGHNPLDSVYVHFGVPSVDGSVIGSSDAQVGTLVPNESDHITASLFVSRNASIVSFPFNLTATYYDSGNLEQSANSTSLVPIGTISLQSSDLTLSPTTTTPGGIFSISFVLTNLGTSTASAVTVSAMPVSGFEQYSTSGSLYIGEISSDQQAPATVTLVTDANTKTGTYTIPLKIGYMNSLRQNVTSYMNVSVTVVSANYTAGVTVRRKSSGNGDFAAGLIAGVIVVLAIGFLLYRRSRIRRRQAQHVATEARKR